MVAGSAAAEAGFQPGDRVLSIDGGTIERFEELQQVVQMSPGKRLTVTVRRDGRDLDLVVVPRAVEATDPFGNVRQIGRLGVSRSGVEFKHYAPLPAVWAAGR